MTSKTAVVNIEAFMNFDNVSAGKKENKKFAGLLYITKI